MSLLKEQIQNTLDAPNPPKEHFLGTFYYSDLAQEDQNMLDEWYGIREMYKVIDGVKFTVVINMDSNG